MKDESNVVKSLIADTQAELYALAEKQGFDVEDFSNKYLNSDFCKLEMDAIYSKYQTEFAEDCMDCLLSEINSCDIKKEFLPVYYNSYLIGRIYRLLFFETDYISAELSQKVPFTELTDICIELENCDEDEIIQEIKDRYQLI
jgi:hypothetical protein